MTHPYRYRKLVGLLAGFALIGAACSGSTEPQAAPTTTTMTAAPTTTVPATTTEPAAATTTTEAPADDAIALTVDGDIVTVDWGALPSSPFFAPAGDGDDPFFHIHTNPATDGFFLSFELYTTGYGAQWTGELGTFDITCDSPDSSTGICPYFDSDGPGPMDVLGRDFATTGSVTIVQLDATGYEINVHELTFTDGTTFSEFTISG